MNAALSYAGQWPVLDQGLLNPELDLAAYAAAFQQHGRVQIEQALRPEVAEFLYQVLDQQVPWHLAYRDRDGSHELPPQQWMRHSPAERHQLEDNIFELAREGQFQFCYFTYMMISAYLQKRDTHLPLNRVVELVNHPSWLEPMRRITGFPQVGRANAQATCYRAGHFLTRHNDASNKEKRLTAYVINLTKEWRSDWGGLLQFLDDDDRVSHTLMPRFNSISMFRTPVMHCVSPVALYAQGSRYTITGWLLTRDSAIT